MDIKNQQKFDNENQENGKFIIPDEKDMQMTWDNVENFKNEYPKPDMSKMWEKTASKLNLNKGSKTIPFRKYFLRYAAAILLPVMLLGIGIYYTIEKINTNKGLISYTSPENLRTKVNLPDGSTIWLQPNSEIKYPKEFSKEKREIFFSGQAYFDIKHNTEWPFVVHIENMDINVLGTQFYVKAKSIENTIETGLIEGSIKITSTNLEKYLIPSDIVVFSKKSNEIAESRTFESNAYQWSNNSMIFENCALGDILRNISDWYDLAYDADPKLDLNTKITLTIKEESIQEIAEILKIVVPFEYKISDNKISFLSRN